MARKPPPRRPMRQTARNSVRSRQNRNRRQTKMSRTRNS